MILDVLLAPLGRIAGKVARVHQPREQGVENRKRLLRARGGEWPRERPPVRVRQKAPIEQQVFVGERKPK